jgi:hypothetical protein
LLVPTIFKKQISLKKSEEHTAHPSIAELSNRGSSTFEFNDSASVRPYDFDKTTVSIFKFITELQANSTARSTETPFSTAVEVAFSSSVLPVSVLMCLIWN